MRAPETEQKQDGRAGGYRPGQGICGSKQRHNEHDQGEPPARLNIPLIRARPEQKEIRLSERVMLLHGGLPTRTQKGTSIPSEVPFQLRWQVADWM